jgi:predicted nucleotidyltransferase
MSDDLKRVEEKSSLNLKPDKSEKVPRIIREQIIKILFRRINPETTTVFLFGSLAENTDMKYSDIDIGIVSGDEISDAVFLSLCDDLNYKADTLRKIDLVDFKKVDNAFRKFALENIEIWHTAENLK